MIIDIKYSNRKDKRFKVLMDDGEVYHFGLKDGQTYIDHNDINKRDAYVKRHMASKIEYDLISNVIPSPSLFSIYLLWGPYKTLEQNIDYLNDLFIMKKNDKKYGP
jgi:hypothetical protein